MGAGSGTDLQADMAQTENQRITQRDGVTSNMFQIDSYFDLWYNTEIYASTFGEVLP